MKVIRFIAGRYLFSRKKVTLISMLTGISIAGITVGTALLIIILSVFNGFYDVVQGFLLSFDPDIRIEHRENQGLPLDTGVMDQLQEHPEVVRVSPYVEQKAMLMMPFDQADVVTVRGIDPENAVRFDDLMKTVERMDEEGGGGEGAAGEGAAGVGVGNAADADAGSGADKGEGAAGAGATDLSNVSDALADGTMLINENIALRFALEAGDAVALMSADAMKQSVTRFSPPRMYRFEVDGIYQMKQILEENRVYVNLLAAQRIFRMPREISGYELELRSPDDAESVKEELEAMLGQEYRFSTWYDLQKPLYDVMELEKWGSFIILMIIILVAVLNIVGSMTMMVIQKKRDIGVLLAMGLTPGAIVKIFRMQGFQIGLIGCGLGGAAGLFLAKMQEVYGWVKLSSAFIIDAYPVVIEWPDVLLVMSGTMLLSVLASAYPAWRGGRTDVSVALRND